MSEPSSQAEIPLLPKVPTGIEGFDQITQGGMPRERITLVVGGPGSGKTVFALQSLTHAARQGEPGIFVAFEENSRQILENAASFGWDLPSLLDRRLYFLDATVTPETVVVGEFELTALLAILKAKAARTGARRIVFDALDILLSLLDDPAAERRELFRLKEWSLESGLTILLTAKLDANDPPSTRRASLLHFMADCVVALDHRVEEYVSLRDLRVVKYRGSAFAENKFPFSVSPTGIEVAGTSPSAHGAAADPECSSSG